MVRVAVAALLSVSLVACQGEQGPAGPAGSTQSAVSNRYCSKTYSTGGGPIVYQYQVVRFASGDAEAICSVTSYTEDRSFTIYYRSGDTGTVTGECWVYYDVDVANGGYWDFRADGGERVTYHDTGSASDHWELAFAAADCTG